MNKYKIISLFIILGALFQGVSFGYFEDKYYCNMSSNSIVVTLNETSNSQKCLAYIKSITQKIESLQKNIDTTNLYIGSGNDIEYWMAVQKDLNIQKKSFESLRSSIVLYMSNFELELFVKIKKLLNYYLQKDLDGLNKSLNLLYIDLSDKKNRGEEVSYVEDLNKLDQIILKINIIKLILNSNDFNNMIPYLKHYIQYNKTGN